MSRTPCDDAARAIAAALTDAWNAGDGAAFAREFTEDADFVNIFATHGVGRDAIAKAHQALFEGIYRGTVIAFSVTKVRPLGDQACVALIGARMDVAHGPMAGEMRALITAVIARGEDGWKIASFQNTRVQAQPFGPSTTK